MEDFICLLLTSNGCGHCQHFRGNGLIENGKSLMKHEFIDSITKHCTFLNIHYKNMSGKTDMIDTVSKFTIKGKNKILQEIYGPKDEISHVSLISSTNASAKNIGFEKILSQGKSVSWKNFLAKKIPPKLSNYTYYYPCFLFVSKKNWNLGLENKNFYAISNAGITKKFPDGTIGLEKSSKSIQERNIKFETLLENLVKKEIDLDPYESGKEIKFEEEIKNFIVKSFEED